MARFRLRLLLQEFDLPPGETLLGRSPDCRVTIDDPLVSREHAKIVVTDDRVTFRDLASRNGSHINGEPALDERELRHADRIRIGSQEIVFSRVTSRGRTARTTGSLRHCSQCQSPYTAEAPSCPTCGFVPGAEDTLGGASDPVDRRQWTFQLQLEVLDRAISLRRHLDCERILAQIAKGLDADAPGHAEPSHAESTNEQLDAVFFRAVQFCNTFGDGQWIRWVFASLQRQQRFPSSALLDRLNELPTIVLCGAVEAIGEALAGIESRSETLDEESADVLDKLRALRDRLPPASAEPLDVEDC